MRLRFFGQVVLQILGLMYAVPEKEDIKEGCEYRGLLVKNAVDK